MTDELMASNSTGTEQSSTPELNLQQLKDKFRKLRFDLYEEGKDSLPRFNTSNGDEFEPGSTEQLKHGVDIRTRAAVENLSFALNIDPKANFDPYTGEKIPQEREERLSYLRGKVAEKVKAAEAKGIIIPKFDPQTGEAIPANSLRMLELTRIPSEISSDVDLGFEILKKMKNR